MQLAQILRNAGPRLWVLVLVPAIALGALAFLVTASPQGTQVVATVGVSAPSGVDTAANITQTVDSFRAALETEAVRDTAAAEVGLDGVPSGNVSTDRVGSSNLVDITVQARNEETLRALVPALVESANELLFQPALSSAQANLEAAQEDFDAVVADVEGLSDDGLVIPAERYRAKASEVTQLRVARASAEARGLGSEAAGLRSAIQRANRELDRLQETYRGLERATFDYDRALNRLADAQAAASAIEARLAAANEDSSVTLGEVSTDSQVNTLTRAIVAALIVGIAVAVGLVLLIGALRRGGDSSA